MLDYEKNGVVCTGFTRLHGEHMDLRETMGVVLLWVDVMVGVYKYTVQPRCWLEKKGCWPVEINTLVLSEQWTSIPIR
jgi:hypothetical protein